MGRVVDTHFDLMYGEEHATVISVLIKFPDPLIKAAMFDQLTPKHMSAVQSVTCVS